LLVAFVPMLMLRPSHDRLAVSPGPAAVCLDSGGRQRAGRIVRAATDFAARPRPGAEQKHTATVLLEILAPGILFSGASGIFAALLYTERRFVAPATYQLCFNGSMIVFALACSGA
jgi:hypothetical protein